MLNHGHAAWSFCGHTVRPRQRRITSHFATTDICGHGSDIFGGLEENAFQTFSGLYIVSKRVRIDDKVLAIYGCSILDCRLRRCLRCAIFCATAGSYKDQRREKYDWDEFVHMIRTSVPQFVSLFLRIPLFRETHKSPVMGLLSLAEKVGTESRGSHLIPLLGFLKENSNFSLLALTGLFISHIISYK